MAETAPDQSDKALALKTVIGRDAAMLSKQLQAHHLNTFPPNARKGIRSFSPLEAAKLLGVAEGYMRNVVLEMEEQKLLSVAGGTGGRRYSVQDIATVRAHLDKNTRASRRYLPHRTEGEELQVIAVMNFKGGSGKTTTAAHLAQYHALRGYRVLAIDLDPQASLSALFGRQPEIHVKPNETLYGAIRYDDQRRPMAEVVRSTYIPDLHMVPGHLELMEFEHDTPRALLKRKPGDTLFFGRVQEAIDEVADNYDIVVIDCPPQLGFLTLSAMTAATSVLITVHPQMLDVMSMNQFLTMTHDLLDEISTSGARNRHMWMRYLITRFEPTDGPQNQMVAFLRSMFADNVMINPMLKTTAVSDAGLTNQTLFEVDRSQFTKSTYDRALESMNNVNAEIEGIIKNAWGRS